MSFPRYPKYKASGVEWLGDVPEHWEAIRLKALLSEVDERVETQELELLGLSKSLGVVPRTQLEQGASESDNYGKYKIVRAGQLVMNKMQAWNGVFGLSPVTGMVSPDYAVFRYLREGMESFLCFLFKTDVMSGVFFTRCRGMGTAFLRLNTGDFFDIKIPVPPSCELQTIAEFLDRETSKIDGLVGEQRRLIELLKEKRHAVISHAVTKGLNPHAPLKPSGIEWLGDVPEHWKVGRIKYECQYESGHTPSKSNEAFWIEEECRIPWVSLNDTKTIDAADFISDTAVKISEVGMNNSSAHLIDEGAVVFTRDGARVGLAAITTKPMCVSQHIIAWVCGPNVSNYFLLHVIYAMNAEIFRITAGSTIPTIGMPDVKGMKMPLPPLAEQLGIVDFLLNERHRFQTLIAQAENAIELLQERRAALISAAVTGKIDVRSFAEGESL